MIHNEAFVRAVQEKQKKRKMTQGAFAKDIGVSQGALSKFYRRGIKDGIVIRVLAKFPELAVFFASNNAGKS
jgi:transcriptional regulator with XRE-family HTH domain